MVAVTPAAEASAAEVKGLIAALRKTCLFQHASDADLFRLALEMERVRFRPGEELGPREGEPQRHLFVVTAGRLARRSRGRRVYESVEDATRPLDGAEAEEVVGDAGAGGPGASGAAIERRNTAGRAPVGTEQQAVVRAVSASPEHLSTISIMCPDRPGLVAKVAAAIRAQGLSIDSSTVNTTRLSRKKSLEAAATAAATADATAERWLDNPVARLRKMIFEHPDERGTKAEEACADDTDCEHTAYQVHEIVDVRTKLPVTDAARMRRVEAALVRTLATKKKDDAADVEPVIVGAGGPATHLNGGYNAFGTLHVFGELPASATTTALTSGVCWRLSSRALRRTMLQRGGNGADNDLPVDIASGLAAEVFRLSNSYSTPLFEQPAQKVNVAAWSVAAAVEAYYRSALNSFLNAAIQGAMAKEGGAGGAAASAARGAGLDLAKLFPEMHVQIPTRVVYITGFKLSRQWLAGLMEEPVAAATARGDERARRACMLVPALLPGVLMTPVSSVLEACNAGHSNPEPLRRRWMRGASARTVREVIFGLGLNNLTDWAEERIPRDVCEGRALRNALGSVAAGVLAGYCSHVPHNLSTMKLLRPAASYRTHVGSLVEAARGRVPRALPPAARDVAATALALLLPKGLGIRTTQVVGSFVLLNGISHLLDQGSR